MLTAAQLREWNGNVPPLSIPERARLQLQPPFNGAVVCFQLHCFDRRVSVYFDAYDQLGSVGEPYWELYDFRTEPLRFLAHETSALERAIARALGVPPP